MDKPQNIYAEGKPENNQRMKMTARCLREGGARKEQEREIPRGKRELWRVMMVFTTLTLVTVSHMLVCVRMY